jgi:hypothetical protein
MKTKNIFDHESFVQKTNEIQSLVSDFVDQYGTAEMEIGERFDLLDTSGFIQVEAICECCKRATYLGVSVQHSLLHRDIRLVGIFDLHDPDEVKIVSWEWLVPASKGFELKKEVA